jgi:hypothetical protein
MMARKEAVDNAVTSLELEGFSFSTEEKYLLERVIKGELSPAALRTYAANRMAVKKAAV